MLDYGSHPIAKRIGENTYAQVSLSVHCAAKRSSDFVEIVLDGRDGRDIGLPDRIEQNAFGRSAAKKTGIETRLTIGFIGFGPAKHLNPAESSIRRFATEGR